jgi:hypothetical protein
MAQQHAMPTASAARPELCPDRVERRIMRAYVQLAAAPDHADGTRAVTLFRLGSLAHRAEKWTRLSALNDAPAKSWSIGLSPKVDSTFGSDALAPSLLKPLWWHSQGRSAQATGLFMGLRAGSPRLSPPILRTLLTIPSSTRSTGAFPAQRDVSTSSGHPSQAVTEGPNRCLFLSGRPIDLSTQWTEGAASAKILLFLR